MPKAYLSLDYAQQTVEIYKKIKTQIIKKVLPINKEEPLKKEIVDFVRLATKNKYNSGYSEAAKDALELACKIEKVIKK